MNMLLTEFILQATSSLSQTKSSISKEEWNYSSHQPSNEKCFTLAQSFQQEEPCQEPKTGQRWKLSTSILYCHLLDPCKTVCSPLYRTEARQSFMHALLTYVQRININVRCFKQHTSQTGLIITNNRKLNYHTENYYYRGTWKEQSNHKTCIWLGYFPILLSSDRRKQVLVNGYSDYCNKILKLQLKENPFY